ncbi:hypothetical protein GCM10008937_07400 [Deinococcus depolymerans]|uniref:Uncharacterized protein n=1 Tax=Deinococcus depolymerans TaxID=392408 RepID=A0ABN1BP31_9DEIO
MTFRVEGETDDSPYDPAHEPAGCPALLPSSLRRGYGNSPHRCGWGELLYPRSQRLSVPSRGSRRVCRLRLHPLFGASDGSGQLVLLSFRRYLLKGSLSTPPSVML